jgi:hypothetical protein
VESLTEVVTRTADAADLHAPVPTLLLELQSLLGALTAAVTDATDRGRRPFRPTPDWTDRFGELAYGIYLLADQSGVDVDAAVRTAAASVQHRLRRSAQQAPAQAEWPFGSE